MEVIAYSNRLKKNISFDFPKDNDFCVAELQKHFRDLLKLDNATVNELSVRFAYKSANGVNPLPLKHAKKEVVKM